MSSALTPAQRRGLYQGDDDDANSGDVSAKVPHFELWWAPKEKKNLFSNWTIVVDVEGSSAQLSQSYSVHQEMIACKSKYFETVFQGAFAESQSKTSSFSFPEKVAKKFELFLDCIYMYDFFGNGGKHLDIMDRIVLLFLLDYFQCEELRDVCFETLTGGFRIDHFISYHDCWKELACPFPYLEDFLVGYGAKLLSCEWSGDTKIHARRILREINVDYFVALFQHKDRDHRNGICGDRLAYFHEKHHSAVDVSLFLRLTSQELLPKCTPKAPLYFLKTLHSYQGEHLDEASRDALVDLEERSIGELDEFVPAGTVEVSMKFLDLMHSYADPATNVNTTSALEDIEDRCIEQLVEFFTNEVPLNTFDDWTLYPSTYGVDALHPRFYRSLLCHAIKTTDFDEAVSTNSTNPKVLISDIRRALEKAKIANASSMPIGVGGGGVRGAYKREGDGYYVSRDRKHRIESHIKRDARGVWHMKMVRFNNEYTSSADSEYEGCPPFSGWRHMSGFNHDTKIGF